MKNLPVKIASVAVIASMALSFAACSKKGGTDSRTESHSGDKIAADSPWFDSKTIDVDVNVDSSRKVDYASTSLVGADEKYLVVMTTGSYTLPDDFDWESMNYNDYMINNLSVIDKASNQTVSTIELAKGLGSDERSDQKKHPWSMKAWKRPSISAIMSLIHLIPGMKSMVTTRSS